MSTLNAVDFVAVWEAGGPWTPVALGVIVGVVTLVVGLMLVHHGTSISSSPLILCSVAGLLIGLALTVIWPQARGALSLCFHAPQLPRITQLPRTTATTVLTLRDNRCSQALERLMTVMPSERIFMIFILAPLLMYIWEHVVRTPCRSLLASPDPTRLYHVSCMAQVLHHQHIHPLADGSTAGCSDVGCEEGCGEIPDEPPDNSTPGSGWTFKPKKAKPGEKTSLLGKGILKKGTVAPSGEAGAPTAADVEGAEVKVRRWMPRGLQPPGWLMWLFEKWSILMRLGAPAVFLSSAARGN